MLRELLRRLRTDEGQALVEYSVIVTLVSIVGVAALQLIGLDVGGLLEDVEAAI